jgi:sugar phosphate isomerase/epimerase
MKLGSDGFFHLTYCTNIHPANGWEEVRANVEQYGPALKERLGPNAAFGLGLRLSSRDSCELLEGDRLQRFKELLDREGLYVAIINGFPYGPFHGEVIKSAVFAPDWREEARVQYTLRLVEILAELMPEDVDGGISTCPLSYKGWVDQCDDAAWESITDNLARIAADLVRVQQVRGKVIHLDIEPEPDGLVEHSREVERFYRRWLLGFGAERLAALLGTDESTAREHLLEHIRVCWDTCHQAVEFEEPTDVLARFDAAGIRVGRIQVSAALKIALPSDEDERARIGDELEPFAESTYLHQVLQRNTNGTLHHYADLPDALAALQDPEAEEWRTHFHVPIFLNKYGRLGSTQDDILKVFRLAEERRFTRHLEIETYTWDVLPADMKRDLLTSVSREYEWVMDALDA